MKIFYVAGYGRSGSTLFDLILSNHPDLIGLGECSNLFKLFNQDKLPDEWKSLVDKMKTDLNIEENVNLEIANVKISSIKKLFQKRRYADDYIKYWLYVFGNLSKKYPSKNFIDSSKTSLKAFFRPKYLAKTGNEVIILHLIRDPFEVAKSYKKGENSNDDNSLRPGRKGGVFRASFNWLLVNSLTSLYYSRKFKGKYLMIKYKDLIFEREKTLNQVAAVGDVENLFCTSNSLSKSKHIGFSGNRMRMDKNIEITPDKTKNTTVHLTAFEKRFTKTMNFLYKKINHQWN